MANSNVVTLQLSEAQAKAVEMMGANAQDIASSAVASTIKSKLNYYRNGATVKDASESTHSVVRTLKGGTKKTIYYKGGLKSGAVAAYNMAKAFLPQDITESVFVNNALAEVDAVLTMLNGATDEVEGDDETETEE